MTKRGRWIVLAPPSHRLTGDALAECMRHAHVVIGNHLNDADLAGKPADLLISFLSDRILPASCLDRPNVNFHPAPPEYPGRGGASYALFDGAETYGATAHVMSERVDAGPILSVSRFPAKGGCVDLFETAENACLGLLSEIARYFAEHGSLPAPNGDKWSGKAKTRKQFNEWLVLDPADPETFRKKCVAARHPKFPGPFIDMHGHRFAMMGTE